MYCFFSNLFLLQTSNVNCIFYSKLGKRIIFILECGRGLNYLKKMNTLYIYTPPSRSFRGVRKQLFIYNMKRALDSNVIIPLLYPGIIMGHHNLYSSTAQKTINFQGTKPICLSYRGKERTKKNSFQIKITINIGYFFFLEIIEEI